MLTSSINVKEMFPVCLFIEKVVIYLWLRRTQTPLPNTVHIMKQYNTLHDFSTFSTSDLTFTLQFVQDSLDAAKVTITTEHDPFQIAGYAERIADYAAGIDLIKKELAAR